MTVIAWDGKTLAADKLMCNGSTRGITTKIFRHGGELLGVTGDLSVGMEMLAWFKAGAVPAEFPASNRDPQKGCSLVRITANGEVFKYESGPHPFECEGTFFAFGSGDLCALVAMECGLTAHDAVEMAAHFDTGCGSGVDTLRLTEAKKRG